MASCTHHKNKLAAWLVCISFLLNAAFFTGYTCKSMGYYQQATQTSLQFVGKSTIAARNISYKKATAALYEVKNFTSAAIYKRSLLTYNKTIKVKFLHINRLFNSNKMVNRFIRLKPAYENGFEFFIYSSIV